MSGSWGRVGFGTMEAQGALTAPHTPGQATEHFKIRLAASNEVLPLVHSAGFYDRPLNKVSLFAAMIHISQHHHLRDGPAHQVERCCLSIVIYPLSSIRCHLSVVI